MISLQTNVNSLVAQQNLRVNSQFQSQTIQQLTSGYRINQAGDDAAGLAVANKFRNDVAELTQGVRNANDGAGQLQIMDGGLNNISQILDRLKTLATESASDTFTGNRATLNNEYQTLLQEVDRQASNIGLVNQGQFNKSLSVYLGGGSTQGNAQVSIDLSGQANWVDSTGLSLASTSIDAGGTTLTGNTVNILNDPTTMILTGGASGGTQTFLVNYIDSNGAQQSLNATVTSTDTNGITVANAVSQLNQQLSTLGLTAAVNSTGSLVLGGTAAFTLVSANITGAGVSAHLGAGDPGQHSDQPGAIPTSRWPRTTDMTPDVGTDPRDPLVYQRHGHQVRHPGRHQRHHGEYCGHHQRPDRIHGHLRGADRRLRQRRFRHPEQRQLQHHHGAERRRWLGQPCRAVDRHRGRGAVADHYRGPTRPPRPSATPCRP